MASESFANDAGPSSSSPSTVTEKAATKPASVSVDSGPVQAYAKLEGDEYCYYIRTLQVTMGRRVSRPGQVDIPLGNAKSVSRHHARLFYNFATQRFEIMVFGKNGAFINEQFVEKGITVPLENRTKIQIGDSSFTFLLPRVNVGQQSAASRVNDSSGYISTPQQLEKHSSRASDADGNDSQDPSSYPANKDGKPPFSYATLIAQAINSTDDKRMALHEIYNYITTHYPYYQMAQNGWQNSIRHNLSLNKAFVKVPRGDAEPGKGAFWTIDPKAEIQFMNGGMNKRNGKRPASKASGAANDSGSSPTPEPRKKIKKEGSDNDEAASSSTGAATSTTTTTAATSGKSAATAATPAATAAIASAAAASTAASMTQSPATTKDTSSSSTSSPNTTSTASTSTTASATNTQQNIQAQIQLQLQSQLQTTIRQHLLDPVRYPLPPSIAQLLPQAIAQLPPHLANQFSATLQSALRAHSNASNNNNNSNNTTTNSSGSETKSKSNTGDKSSSNEPANKSS